MIFSVSIVIRCILDSFVFENISTTYAHEQRTILLRFRIVSNEVNLLFYFHASRSLNRLESEHTATFDTLEPTSLQTKSSMDEETITVDTISDDSISAAMLEANDEFPTPDSTKVKLIGQNGKFAIFVCYFDDEKQKNSSNPNVLNVRSVVIDCCALYFCCLHRSIARLQSG